MGILWGGATYYSLVLFKDFLRNQPEDYVIPTMRGFIMSKINGEEEPAEEEEETSSDQSSNEV